MEKPKPTGRDVTFGDDEIIVSKTDLRGRLTYVNDIFINIAGYTEADLIGQPHNVIRHPDMPRCIFKLLWDTIQARTEIFAYVQNMTARGDGYWVLAHVTPSFSEAGEIVGYHSNRRKPTDSAVNKARELYRELRAMEEAPTNRKDGMTAATERLESMLTEKGVSYDQFILSL